MRQAANSHSDETCPINRFTFLTAQDIRNMPPVRELVHGVLPSKGLGSFYGAPGSGKSYLAISLAAAIASDRDWFGHQVEPHKVVYLALEGAGGIPRRIGAWEAFHKAGFPSEVEFVFEPFSLTTDSKCLAQRIKDRGDVGLVIIDTLNRSAPGADENSPQDMGRIINGAAEIQKAIGGLVILIHHCGKNPSKGLRGHSSLEGALDVIIEVERTGTNRAWKIVKYKDGPDGLVHGFRLATVDLGVDDFDRAISSCAVDEVEIGPELGGKIVSPRGENQKIILEAFKALDLQRRMDRAMVDEDLPAGIELDEAASSLKDCLQHVGHKHQLLRAKEALLGLVKTGYLINNGGALELQPAG